MPDAMTYFMQADPYYSGNLFPISAWKYPSTVVVEKPGIADNRSGLKGLQTQIQTSSLSGDGGDSQPSHYFGTWLLISTGKFGGSALVIVFGCDFPLNLKFLPICWAGSCQSCPRASRRYPHRHPYARRMRRQTSEKSLRGDGGTMTF